MRYLTVCLLLAGCGSASDLSLSPQALTGTAVPGAQVKAYPLLPDGRIGQDREGVSAYPVEPPTPLARTSADAQGKFTLELHGPGPFAVEANTGTVPWRVLLPDGNGPIRLDTASTLGASADLARMRLGLPPTYTLGPSGELSEADREAQMEAIESAPVVSPKGYSSPYSLSFPPELTADLENWQVSQESDLSDWYDPALYTQGQLSWGPKPHVFPGMSLAGAEQRRQRVLAVGAHWVGTHYQHHHIPDWAPSNWPAWQHVSLGHNSAGIDCSDFTAWCYNVGLGIQLTSNVAEQAAAGPALFQVQGYEVADYTALTNVLQAGDLLYIRANSGRAGQPITHVIMWVGGPDHLIMDSHDNTPPIQDSNGNVIPAGVHLRPFKEGSWYHKAFDHFHRHI